MLADDNLVCMNGISGMATASVARFRHHAELVAAAANEAIGLVCIAFCVASARQESAAAAAAAAAQMAGRTEAAGGQLA
jgi:hypothetical protein